MGVVVVVFVVVGGEYFGVMTLKVDRPKVKVNLTLVVCYLSLISQPKFSSGWDPLILIKIQDLSLLDQISLQGGINPIYLYTMAFIRVKSLTIYLCDGHWIVFFL